MKTYILGYNQGRRQPSFCISEWKILAYKHREIVICVFVRKLPQSLAL
jgi:hypothetical protein